MSGREMRLAEQDKDHGIGMALPNFRDLRGGMAVAGPNLAQIFTRHAVEAVKRFGMVAGRDQQFVERVPVVSPVEVEADALAKFLLVDFAPPPNVENVLIAREDRFHAKDDRAVTG